MEKLQFINQQMAELSVPYEFGEWTTDVIYPYCVGEVTEEPITTEDGAETSTFILNFFHRGSYADLESIKARIKQHFQPIFGLRASHEGGAIAVFYESAFYVPTNEADLKRLQINLTIKEWKGAL